MPLITTDQTVSTYLNNGGFDINVNLLIIAENYPRGLPGSYFYRSVYHEFVPAGLPAFFNTLCKRFGIQVSQEAAMLTEFLNGTGIGNGQRLLIDALQNHTLPAHPIAANRLTNLIADITAINPNYIMIIHNRNIDTVTKLIADTRFAPFLQRLLVNPLAKVHRNIFPFPSAPSNPNHFADALSAVRLTGILI